MSLIEQIGIENVLNSILVNENVRPAMLVQPANYDEATGKDPKTKSIIEAVKKQFPTLLFSEDYKTYQGVIISKTDYTGQEISLERMGEILGYPCYQDFNAIDPTHISYSINVYVKQKSTNEITDLFSNVCKDETNIEKFKSFADRAKLALNKKEYKDILNGIEIDKVGVEIEKIIPTQAIINKLHRPKRKKRQNAVMIYIFYNYVSGSLLNVILLYYLLIFLVLYYKYLHMYLDFLF